jgi:phenylpropionate dioxygenase-like ring-hydroxylating dioxygenase large terminal subunit
MRALITPEQYTSSIFFNQEMTKVFEKCWIFACMLNDVEENTHYGVKVGSKNLIIQLDINKSPKAFINSCSHRGSLLCEEGRQSGRVRCPYHGWVYNNEGVPVGIPSKTSFPEVVQNPQAFKLQEVTCDIVGKFIFICFEKNQTSLRQYLGDEYDFLKKISLGLGDDIFNFQKPVEANWKVVIENSLEGYHVPTVHQKTFLISDGMSKSINDINNFISNSFHSYMNNSVKPEWLNSFNNKFAKKIGKWPYQTNNYTHHHIFPNLTITSFLGYSFHIQLFKPVSQEMTNVHSRTYGTYFKNQSLIGEKIIKKIYDDANEFTSKVFDEDAHICNLVQKGLNNSRGELIISESIEERICHFQQTYNSLFG